MDERRPYLLLALAFALCLVAGSSSRIVGDGGEYLAQALNFAALNRPSLGRQAIPAIERRIVDLAPALAEWDIDAASVAGPDRRRDFLHFWFYALLVTPLIWITELVGLSPLHAFTALNLALLGVALRVAMPRIGAPALVLLFASPLIWWIDKAHTEVFTVSLLTIAIVTMRDRPWWALIASGMAATQNPPITAVVLLILGVEVFRRRTAVFTDRRVIAGAVAGLGLAALPPVYTYARHDTPSLLLYATRPGLPTWAELSAAVLDPSMGLVGNYPLFLLATAGAVAWLLVRHRRALLTSPVVVAVVSALVFLYSFAQTSNPHHGATPSLTRYALWFIPLSMAVWMPVKQLGGPGVRRTVAAAATVSALLSVFAFHPGVGQNSHEPTMLASWLWTRHPGWNNPLPEVFSETLLHVEGTTVPVATTNCEKVLLAGPLTGDDPVWPVPCLPAPVPARCQTPGTLCYANRRGGDYDFVDAPGREIEARLAGESGWPRATEPHVRRVYLGAGWPVMVAAGPSTLEALREQEDVRVAAFGTDDHFLLVLRPTGPNAVLRFRTPVTLRGTLIDASTGEVLTTIALDGPIESLWNVPIPNGTGGLVLLTMHRGDHTE